MQIQLLNIEDKEKLKVFSKQNKLFRFFISIFIICFSFITIYSIWINDGLSLLTCLFLFPIIIISGIYEFLRNKKLNENEQYKMIGQTKIIRKNYDSDFYSYSLLLEDSRVNEIIVSESQFKRFKTGDLIYLEVTQKAKNVIVLEKK